MRSVHRAEQARSARAIQYNPSVSWWKRLRAMIELGAQARRCGAGGYLLRVVTMLKA
jgi:hypothetical protein